MRPDVIFCAEGSAFITVYIFIHNINISTYAHQIFPHSLANAIFKNASMLHLLRWLRWRAQSGLLWAPWGSGRDLRYPSRVRALLGPGPTPQKENTNQEITNKKVDDKKNRHRKIDHNQIHQWTFDVLCFGMGGWDLGLDFVFHTTLEHYSFLMSILLFAAPRCATRRHSPS